ncbi:MAG: hypothetical protein H6942_07915 [Candidatus Accumulibacter sp.]|nr:hypothetical protein [Accumulibacter sp.]
MPQTRLVYVADREADIVGLMQRAQALGTPADWLIRARHNRCLPQGGKLWAATLAKAPLGEIEFTLASRHGQPKRIVRQQLRSHADRRQDVGGLGDEEVQTAEGPQDTGEQVSRTAFREEAVSLCALAERHGRCVCLMGAV